MNGIATASTSFRCRRRRSSSRSPGVTRSSGSSARIQSPEAASATTLRTASTTGTGAMADHPGAVPARQLPDPSVLSRSRTTISSAQAADSRHGPSLSASLRQTMQALTVGSGLVIADPRRRRVIRIPAARPCTVEPSTIDSSRTPSQPSVRKGAHEQPGAHPDPGREHRPGRAVAAPEPERRRGAGSVAVVATPGQSALTSRPLVQDDHARLVPRPSARAEQPVEEVHVQPAAERRARAEALVAAADPLEPVAAEGEVVPAADVPGHRPRPKVRGSALTRDETAYGLRQVARAAAPGRRAARARDRLEDCRDPLEPVLGGHAVVVDHSHDLRLVCRNRVVLRRAEPPGLARRYRAGRLSPRSSSTRSRVSLPVLWSATTISAGRVRPSAREPRQRRRASTRSRVEITTATVPSILVTVCPPAAGALHDAPGRGGRRVSARRHGRGRPGRRTVRRARTAAWRRLRRPARAGARGAACRDSSSPRSTPQAQAKPAPATVRTTPELVRP